MFKQNLNVYFKASSGIGYKLPIYPDVSFSQVFSEGTIEQKTLHNPENLISDGFTSVLNVGNFSFTAPVMDSTAFSTLLSIMFETPVKSHTLVVENEGSYIQYNSVVFTEIVFNINKNQITTISVSGNFSHSEKVFESAMTNTDLGEVYTYIEGIGVNIDGLDIERINGFSIEIKNGVNWLENKTVHDTGPVHKTQFITSDRVISGNIVQYDDMANPSYNDNSPMLVQIKSSGVIFLEFEFPKIINTTRNQLDLLNKKGIDYRVTDNNKNQIRIRGVNIL
tara:strand:+ start:485 stop:1324 length:840 start_codon:yes stop_codon:yes gene_type:complete